MRLPCLSAALLLSMVAACGNDASSDRTTPEGTAAVGEGEHGEGSAEQSTADSTHGREGPRRANAPPGRIDDGFFVTDDAPPPQACVQDEDCRAGGVLADDGCCWSFRAMNAYPVSVVYERWEQQQRQQHCHLERCPPPPVPAQPPDCLFEVSCGEGACTNACE